MIKKLALLLAVSAGSLYSTQAHAYYVTCSFSDGDGWWGSTRSMDRDAAMSMVSACDTQGGTFDIRPNSLAEWFDF